MSNYLGSTSIILLVPEDTLTIHIGRKMCINNKILPYLLQLQGELAVFHSIIAGIQSNHLSLARHVHSCSHARFAESMIRVPVTLPPPQGRLSQSTINVRASVEKTGKSSLIKTWHEMMCGPHGTLRKECY